MPSTEPERQNRVTEIVPVDDQTRAAQSRHDPGDLKRGHRRRRLHEQQIGPGDAHQRAEQPGAGPQRVDHGQHAVHDLRPTAGLVTPARLVEAVYGHARMLGEKPGERRALVADEIDVRTALRKRMRVILHAGTPPKISYNHDGGAHVRMKPNVIYLSSTRSVFRQPAPRDEPHPSLERQVRPCPFAKHRHAVAESDERDDVDEQPEQPGEEP